ncbi:MAG TPA: HEAT repeat domain-containing protein, partial [Planctomycetaceae bacterium]
DLKSGRNNGRIYRITPPGFRSPPPPRLSKATSAELVAALESPHGWWRDTASRLIYERQDKTAGYEIRKVASDSKLPPARAQALWSLEGLDLLDDDAVIQALSNPLPGIRENALRLSDRRLDDNSKLLEAVLTLMDDSAPRVRFQAAFSLGQTRDRRAAAALADMARRDGGDRWIRTAILSSAGEMAADLFDELIRDADRDSKSAATAPFVTTEAGAAILGQLANLIGVRNRDADIRRALEALAASPLANESAVDNLLVELGRGVKRAGGRLEYGGTNKPVGAWLQTKLTAALKAAADTAGDHSRKLRGIELVSCAPSQSTRDTFQSLIRPDQPESIQVAAVRALSDDPDHSVAPELLSRFNSLTPEVRRIALNALLSREERTLALLEAASRDEVSLTDVEQTRRDVLVKHKNEAIRKLATALFATSGTAARTDVLAQYQAALTLPAKAGDGKTVFEKTCANCHQLGGKGYAIGPNLASSPSRDGAVLLTHILDPSQYVLPNYVQYVVVDKQGRSFTGLLAAQTATSVTLKKEKDESVTILRRDIEEMATSGKSLMPDGLEKNISVQEMANLLAYLREAATGDSYAERDFGTLPGLIETNGKR